MKWAQMTSTVLGRALSLLVCLCLSMSNAIAAANTPQMVKPEGRTEIGLKGASAGLIRLVILQTKVGDSFPYKDALMWGGDVGELPQSALTSIQVQEGNEVIFVPLSAYGDLGDVKSASLDQTAQGFALNLHGGNTAAAYDATLSFVKGYLVSRVVVLREFPEQRQERTSYQFPDRSHT